MSRLLVTMNTGGAWTPKNVRDSHIAAAARWDRLYVEIKEAPDVFGDKHRWLAGCDAESVVWVDGDAIIRFDCPDPHTPGVMAGVAAVQSWDGSDTPHQYAAEQAMGWVEWATRQLGFTLHDDRKAALLERSINGGVFAFEPKRHRVLFEWIARTLPEGMCNPMVEQTLLNLGIFLMNLDVEVLPWTYNRVGPVAWKPGPMRYHVQHLANCGMEQDKREALGLIYWREKAADPGAFVGVAQGADAWAA